MIANPRPLASPSGRHGARRARRLCAAALASALLPLLAACAVEPIAEAPSGGDAAVEAVAEDGGDNRDRRAASGKLSGAVVGVRTSAKGAVGALDVYCAAASERFACTIRDAGAKADAPVDFAAARALYVRIRAAELKGATRSVTATAATAALWVRAALAAEAETDGRPDKTKAKFLRLLQPNGGNASAYATGSVIYDPEDPINQPASDCSSWDPFWSAMMDSLESECRNQLVGCQSTHIFIGVDCEGYVTHYECQCNDSGGPGGPGGIGLPSGVDIWPPDDIIDEAIDMLSSGGQQASRPDENDPVCQACANFCGPSCTGCGCEPEEPDEPEDPGDEPDNPDGDPPDDGSG